MIAYSGWCLYLGVSANKTTMGFCVIMRYNKVSSLKLWCQCLGNWSNIICVSCTFKQKYSVAGSSQFVPSLNAITSNQDLQWMLQPSLLCNPGPSRALRPSYPLPPRIPSMNPQLTLSHLSRPGVIRAATAVGSSTRSRNNEHVSLIVSLSTWWVMTGDCDSMVCHHVHLSSSPFLSVVLAKTKPRPSHACILNQSVEDTDCVISCCESVVCMCDLWTCLPIRTGCESHLGLLKSVNYVLSCKSMFG